MQAVDNYGGRIGDECGDVYMGATSIDRGATGNGLSSNGLLLTRVTIPLLPVGLEFSPSRGDS